MSQFPHQSLRAHRTGATLLALARPERGVAAACRMDRPLSRPRRASRSHRLPAWLTLVDTGAGGDDCGGYRGTVMPQKHIAQKTRKTANELLLTKCNSLAVFISFSVTDYSVNISGCSFKYISRKGKLNIKHTSGNDKSYGLSCPLASFII